MKISGQRKVSPFPGPEFIVYDALSQALGLVSTRHWHPEEHAKVVNSGQRQG